LGRNCAVPQEKKGLDESEPEKKYVRGDGEIKAKITLVCFAPIRLESAGFNDFSAKGRARQMIPILAFIVDAVALIGIVGAVDDENKMDMQRSIVAALIIGVTGSVCMLTLRPSLGVLALGPVLGVAILVIWLLSGLPLKQAVFIAMVFIVCKIAILFTLLG
jgi:hypothetical protein